MVITSVNNEKIKELVKLKDKKYRDKKGLFFVEGIDIISEAYNNKLLKHIYVLSDYDNPFEDIPCTYITEDVMKKISDMDSISKYYGVCEKKKETELGNRIIILDSIQDPGNLGTIIRSAVAFNFDTVVIGTGSVDLYNSKVLRSTKGMIFNINIITRDLNYFMDILDEYIIYGTDVIDGVNVREIIMPEKLALVIGNEGNGISSFVRDKCDKFIYIDMNNKCESLNAGVAASILMYEVNNK
ncbi:MAG: RNA methyltransferase [Bacilli bacterium]|nr:RNA methyltransferase [Bacilli bacterium]